MATFLPTWNPKLGSTSLPEEIQLPGEVLSRGGMLGSKALTMMRVRSAGRAAGVDCGLRTPRGEAGAIRSANAERPGFAGSAVGGGH